MVKLSLFLHMAYAAQEGKWRTAMQKSLMRSPFATEWSGGSIPIRNQVKCNAEIFVHSHSKGGLLWSYCFVIVQP